MPHAVHSCICLHSHFPDSEACTTYVFHAVHHGSHGHAYAPGTPAAVSPPLPEGHTAARASLRDCHAYACAREASQQPPHQHSTAEHGSLAPSAPPAYLLLPLLAPQAQLLPSAVWRPDAGMAHSHSHTYVMHSHPPLAELRPHAPASPGCHTADSGWAELLPLHAHLPCTPAAS